MKLLNIIVLSGLLLFGVGCKSLLPKKTTVTHDQWTEYSQVSLIGSHIHAGQTLDDLKLLGIDVDKTENIEHLTHLDVAKRFGLIGGKKDASLKTPEGVQLMLDAAEKGRGYELTIEHTSQARTGNFWKDFLSFKRQDGDIVSLLSLWTVKYSTCFTKVIRILIELQLKEILLGHFKNSMDMS